MSLRNGWLVLQLRPRVIHHLPGRMRVHVPALRRVAASYRKLVDSLLVGFELPGGICSAQVSYPTGNLLILYDTGRVGEKEVLGWLFAVKEIVGQVLERFADMDAEEAERVGGRLLAFFRTESQRGTRIDKTFAIPDEIWR